ncbi:hypothetical protein PSPTOT1_5600 [Pseudomonas syringae pv. tomato T1]|nr:hypothetical protein PSPTOT1_5600 [Pseudomonas syringae pv. tomato T1]
MSFLDHFNPPDISSGSATNLPSFVHVGITSCLLGWAGSVGSSELSPNAFSTNFPSGVVKGFIAVKNSVTSLNSIGFFSRILANWLRATPAAFMILALFPPII